MSLIPIEQVAPDQRNAIAAFRAGGGRSFQDAGSMAAARDNYVASSQANGTERVELREVSDARVGSGEASFGVRVYEGRPQAGAHGADGASPVVVFFHAGGWVIGNLETHDTLCRRLAELLRLPVVAVDYRLGPEHRFPAAHDDAVRAIEWVRDEAAARGWDPQRLVTIGDSAGGGLATMLASQPEAAVTGTRIVAQALLYPVLDLSAESASYARVEAVAGVPLSAATMRWFAENYLADASTPEGAAQRDAEARDPRVSPTLFARAQAERHGATADAPQPPAFILSLGLDPLSDEIVEYASLLARVGTEVEHVHLPRNAHGIFTTAGKVASGREQLERAAAFIARQLAALEA